MDLDAGTVTGIVGFGTAIVAMLRTRDEAKAKAYRDARADLAKCAKETKEQSKQIDGLTKDIDILGRGLNDCISKHDASEKRVEAIREELDDVRRSILSGGHG